MRWAAFFVVLLATFAAARPVAAAGPEPISFPGAGGVLGGVIYRPDGAGPFPAVVALHGCGGLWSTRRRDGGPLPNARHDDWGRRLSASGFIVLFPDSYGSRGLGSQCRETSREIRPGRERVADANEARAFLQGRPDVRPDEISLLGWSNGGSTVLYGVQPGRVGRGQDFRNAIAFYPGCRLPLERGWSTRMPLLVLVGSEDDWTGAESCRQLVAASGGRAQIVVYPGALHDFDDPLMKPHTRTGLAYTVGGAGTARAGSDPAARADALRRVPAFLAGR